MNRPNLIASPVSVVAFHSLSLSFAEKYNFEALPPHRSDLFDRFLTAQALTAFSPRPRSTARWIRSRASRRTSSSDASSLNVQSAPELEGRRQRRSKPRSKSHTPPSLRIQPTGAVLWNSAPNPAVPALFFHHYGDHYRGLHSLYSDSPPGPRLLLNCGIQSFSNPR